MFNAWEVLSPAGELDSWGGGTTSVNLHCPSVSLLQDTPH